MPSPSVPLRSQSADTDEFADRFRALGWCQDRTQLEAGPSSGRLEWVQTRHLVFAKEHHDRGLLASSCLPPWHVAFGMLGRGQQPQRYAGERLREMDVATATASGHPDLATHGSFSFEYVTVERAWLERICQSALGCDLEAVFPSTRVLSGRSARTDPLRASMARTFGLLGSPRRAPQAVEEVEDSLALSLLRTLAAFGNRGSNRHGTFVPRHAVLSRARSYIEAHLEGPVRMSDVCAAAGVGIRALQVAFQEQLDLSPYAYLLHRRLHRARSLLLRADPHETTVASIAASVGWGHLGRFSVRFRELFGISPSALAGAARGVRADGQGTPERGRRRRTPAVRAAPRSA